MTMLKTLFHRAKPIMTAPLASASSVQDVLAVRRARPLTGLGGGTKASPLPFRFGQYHVFDAPSGDVPGGPTHQPGVMPGHGYEALRTPFGQTGTPGAGRGRNVTDLDLAANRHPDGYPFAAANGRSTRKVPVMQRQKPASAP